MKEALYLDADDTIWAVLPDGIASNCLPPYEREDDVLFGRTPEGDMCTIILFEGVRELIDYAKSKGMDVVLVSQNDPEPVKEAVRALDLHFDREYVSYDNKFRTIAEDMRKHHIDHAYFVDDVYGTREFAKMNKYYKSIEDRVDLYTTIEDLIEDLFRY